MMKGIARLIPAALSALILLTGCAEDAQRRAMGRWGPNPVLQASDADKMLTNQLQVLSYISQSAKIPINNASVEDPRWYNIAEWGFNIGRADCTIYLDNLFVLARERTRTNGMLLDASAAATAIVTATSPHATALSIIAPAFGLAGNVSNRIFDSYLFSDTSPGLIQSKVKDIQDGFKTTIQQNKEKVNTSAAAYAAIQDYYNFCLPQSIEGILLEKIANSTVVATDPGVSPKPVVAKTASGETITKVLPAAKTLTPKMSLQ